MEQRWNNLPTGCRPVNDRRSRLTGQLAAPKRRLTEPSPTGSEHVEVYFLKKTLPGNLYHYLNHHRERWTTMKTDV